MADLGWAADGIERAIAVGGVPLDLYRRPGFTGGVAVRRSDFSEGGCGEPVYDEPWDDEGEPEDIYRQMLRGKITSKEYARKLKAEVRRKRQADRG